MKRPAPRAPGFGSAWTSLEPALTPWIADVIAGQGFERMTPVQAGTIPRAVKHQDCVVEAVTGSGKTLAFVVPVLERMVRNEHKYRKGEVAAIVIAPTRELASQIHQVFNMFLATIQPPPPEPVEGEETPLPVPGEYPLATLITSGTTTPYDTFFQLQSNILVGTPGRLASFLLGPRGMNAVRVGNLDVLVLDEADRLLSAPDHRRDVERIMRHLPKQRRTHLFSATMTDAVEEMVGLGLRNPVRIVVNLKDKRVAGETQERRVPMGLQNTYTVCNAADKTLQLVRVLDREAAQHEASKMIVYFSTCAAVDYFYRVLSRLPELARFSLTSFHGDLPPRVRESSLAAFNSHASSHLSPAVLLCTDVASRGVDFPDIDVVVQYDAPTDPKTFSHRVGRTARAGRAGRAILLLSSGREEEYVNFLSVRKIPLARTGYLSSTLEEVEAPPAPVDPESIALMNRVREIVLTDRDLSDRAAKGMVSSVRAYTKHEASFIFRPTEIDFAALGTAFGVLRLPAMPEIRDWRKRCEKAKKRFEERKNKIVEDKPTDAAKAAETTATATATDIAPAEAKEEEEYVPPVDWTDAEVDWDTFAYATKARETARLVALDEKKAKIAASGPRDDSVEKKKRKIQAEVKEAWSNQKDRKARRDERHDKKDTRKRVEWEKKLAAGEDAPEPEKRVSKKKKVVDSDDELMADDYRSLKKEVHRERADKKATRAGAVKESAGMFDDLD